LLAGSPQDSSKDNKSARESISISQIPNDFIFILIDTRMLGEIECNVGGCRNAS